MSIEQEIQSKIVEVDFHNKSGIIDLVSEWAWDEFHPKRGLKMNLISIGPDFAEWNTSNCPDNFYENDTTRSPANLP